MTPIDIEQAIVARLVTTLKDIPAPLVKFVYDTKEYGGLEEQSQLVPAAAVIYNGYRPGEQVGQGTSQVVEFEFLIVIVARSSKDTLRSSGAKAAASVIFDAALRSLTGWKPGEGAGRLLLTEAPGAGYSDAGYTYLPMGFKTRVTYHPQT